MPVRNWRDVFAQFKAQLRTGQGYGGIVSALGPALNDLVKSATSALGACKGGNEFLVATSDPATEDLSITRFSRHNDVREFKPPTLELNPSQTEYMEFLGDTAKLQGYISNVKSRYSSSMSQEEAIDFAILAIENAIPVALAAGTRTIGGDFIRVLALSKSGVITRQSKFH